MKGVSSKTVTGKDARIRTRLAIGILILVVAGCLGCKGSTNSPTPKANAADDKSDNRISGKSLSNDNSTSKDDKQSNDTTGEIPPASVLQEMTKTTILEFNDASAGRLQRLLREYGDGQTERNFARQIRGFLQAVY